MGNDWCVSGIKQKENSHGRQDQPILLEEDRPGYALEASQNNLNVEIGKLEGPTMSIDVSSEEIESTPVLNHFEKQKPQPVNLRKPNIMSKSRIAELVKGKKGKSSR